MTKLNRTLKGLTALLMSLAMAVTMGLAALAASTETVTETVVVTQVIAQNTTPKRVTYTYILTPKRAENPMPEGTEDGMYTVGPIDGATTDSTAPTFTFEIDKTQPGVYEYILEKVETTPDGDSFSPEKHIFGYKVERNDNGELVVIPYICQSGQPIFSDPDENGYPTKLTLPNVITGAAQTSPTSATTTRTGTRSVTGNVRSTTRATTTGSIRARWVNTGDESQLLLWVTILVAAALALVILVLARRRKDDDEEETK